MSYLTEDNKRNIIIGAVTLLTMFFACITTISLYEVIAPEHVESDTVTVTMADFDRALAKWKAQEPEEYVITTKDGADLMSLRVRPKKGAVQIVHRERGGIIDPVDRPGYPVFRSSGHGADNRTVDGLFATAKEMLELASLKELITPRQDDTSYFHDFNIQFHPDLGYPTVIEHKVRIADPDNEIIWREYGQSPKKVEKLEIVR